MRVIYGSPRFPWRRGDRQPSRQNWGHVAVLRDGKPTIMIPAFPNPRRRHKYDLADPRWFQLREWMTDVIRCWRGKHRVKFGNRDYCINCGRKVT